MNTSISSDDTQFKIKIVRLILNKKTEQALSMLSQHYHVSMPKLKVGMPKGSVKHQGCYVTRSKTIHVANSSNFYNPYIILHEFYHHLRTSGGKHKGTEKNADKFAKNYINTFYRYFTAQD